MNITNAWIKKVILNSILDQSLLVDQLWFYATVND